MRRFLFFCETHGEVAGEGEGQGRQDKEIVSQCSTSDCLHILFRETGQNGARQFVSRGSGGRRPASFVLESGSAQLGFVDQVEVVEPEALRAELRRRALDVTAPIQSLRIS